MTNDADAHGDEYQRLRARADVLSEVVIVYSPHAMVVNLGVHLIACRSLSLLFLLASMTHLLLQVLYGFVVYGIVWFEGACPLQVHQGIGGVPFVRGLSDLINLIG